MSGFELCYNVSGVANVYIQFPDFAFLFNGGSDMVLPQDNYFLSVSSDTYCLAFFGFVFGPAGPTVILGSYQQRNLYILYDREMNHLGFTKKVC